MPIVLIGTRAGWITDPAVIIAAALFFGAKPASDVALGFEVSV